MKTLTIALTASLVAVALPFVSAEEPCGKAGLLEAIDHPTQRGQRYYFLDVTKAAKVGEWAELNRAEGLQTMSCDAGYRADKQISAILG